MTENPEAKRPSESFVTMSQMMNPQHANPHGNVHGGWIMKLVDEAAGWACMKHAQSRIVTVALDQMTFQHPIHVGDLVTITAEVGYVGTTSMEVEVTVSTENPIINEKHQTNRAYLVFVALDENEKPTVVPRLILETEEEKMRFEEALKRQEYRREQLNNRRNKRSGK